MALKQKQRNDLDKLFEDLGILDYPDKVEVPKTSLEMAKEAEAKSESEDPFAKFL